jgi:hypothetical protein
VVKMRLAGQQGPGLALVRSGLGGHDTGRGKKSVSRSENKVVDLAARRAYQRDRSRLVAQIPERFAWGSRNGHIGAQAR